MSVLNKNKERCQDRVYQRLNKTNKAEVLIYILQRKEVVETYCLFETRGGAPIRALKYNFIYNVKSENTNQLNINWLN